MIEFQTNQSINTMNINDKLIFIQIEKFFKKKKTSIK